MPMFFASSTRSRNGQMLVLFAVMALVLILFVGLGVDSGNIYVTRAALSKSLDAAVLTAARNLGAGQPEAKKLADAAFALNYHGGGADAAPVKSSITFSNDVSNNLIIHGDATAVIQTYFIRLLPKFRTFTVRSSSEAMRTKLILSLVLDRSGSMNGNGGANALSPAVSDFISNFDDNMDIAGMVTFASNYGTNVVMKRPFKDAIKRGAKSLGFNGATFSDGGLHAGFGQNMSIVSASGENVFRAVVFFTDGLANTFQGTWSNRIYNVGGTDPPRTDYFVLFPGDGSQASYADRGQNPPPGLPWVTKFLSIDGTNKTVNAAAARLEGQLRAEDTAKKIRMSGITVYSIGLGDGIDKDFLKEVANDPTSKHYNGMQPAGEAVFAPTSKELGDVFQQIAARIAMRLTM